MGRPKKKLSGVKFKYQLTCKECGLVWRYQNQVAIVRNYEYYHCECGGKLELTEL